MKKLVKVVSSVVIALSFAGMGSQVVSAATAPLATAQVAPTDPAIKKGQKIVVVVKDTKKQTVSVYNAKAEKTNKSVKMGSEYTAKAVKKVNGKKIVKVSNGKWLNTKDVTQD
ncbi:hypothetical protein [Lactobacillus agrestimuris]|uniref:hypothetical protein n=1 Tax=Lactobacillus agrestimuris TaxID=2941328 RepID=UPI002043CDBD|nr:hypothetical protein [Lactobacillus agrestimuris]